MEPDDFKGKYFASTIILWRYGSMPASYANVSDLLAEREISIHRWFIQYAPVLHKNSKNINLFVLFPSSNTLDIYFPRNVTGIPPMNFSNGY
ncbi:hypothetical protein UA45_12375 [Morganella morganii]|uniref:Uncharacterized protein n=1 Tax=Morganella morganii TaxID=582 RepID=A0A0D8L9N7_MORMO|nr:hypothetical protein UA45_12375 [Morganella morganii]